MSCSQLLVHSYCSCILSGLIFAKSQGILPIHHINSIWAVMRRWGRIAATFTMFCPCIPVLCTVIMHAYISSSYKQTTCRVCEITVFVCFCSLFWTKVTPLKCSMLFFRPCVNCLEMQDASLNFEIFLNLTKFKKKISAIFFQNFSEINSLHYKLSVNYKWLIYRFNLTCTLAKYTFTVSISVVADSL